MWMQILMLLYLWSHIIIELIAANIKKMTDADTVWKEM
jgi:hypothetical protein